MNGIIYSVSEQKSIRNNTCFIKKTEKRPEVNIHVYIVICNIPEMCSFMGFFPLVNIFKEKSHSQNKWDKPPNHNRMEFLINLI